MEYGYEAVARGLAERGHETALVTTSGGRAAEPFSTSWEIPTSRPGKYSEAWWKATSAHIAPWTDWSPDIYFSVSRAGAVVPSRTAPILAQCHGTAYAEVKSSIRTRTVRELSKVPLNLLRVFQERDFYRRVDCVVAIGEAVYSQLIRSPIQLEASKLTTIPNGTDQSAWNYDLESRTRWRQRIQVDDDTSVGITTSRLHRQKGIDLAIDAVSASPGERHLIICGSGPEQRNLRDLVARRGIAERVSFLGRLSAPDLSGAMSAADLMLLPTRREEGLPLGLLEALANGLPVLTTPQAQAPSGTEEFTRIVPANAQAFSDAWRELVPRRTTSSLPPAYTLTTAISRYETALSNLMNTH